jgi:hypothetical protein
MSQPYFWDHNQSWGMIRIESKSKSMALCEKKGTKNIPKRKAKALGVKGKHS